MTIETERKYTGRTSKLTPELITKLTELIREGNYFSTACFAVGINDSSLYAWLKEAEGIKGEPTEEQKIYVDLQDAIKKAEAEAEAERVSRIRAAGIGGQVIKRITRTKRDGTTEVEESINAPQWLADMTHLERRHPKRWGRADRLAIDQHTTQEIRVTHVEIALTDSAPAIEGQARELLPEGKNATE
jgi:transposase-like protein